MENEQEVFQIDVAMQSLEHHWQDRRDYDLGGNMFVYYSLSQARQVLEEEQLEIPHILKRYTSKPAPSKPAFRGPDFFVVLGVDNSTRRQKWVVWEEDGQARIAIPLPHGCDSILRKANSC